MEASSMLSNNFTFSSLLHKKKKQNSNYARSLSGKDLQNQNTRLLEEANAYILASKLNKPYLHLLPHRMKHDRGDRPFPDLERNGSPFG